MRLCCDVVNKVFVLICRYKERSVAKAHRFAWNKKRRRWESNSAWSAAGLFPYADESCKKILNKYYQYIKESISISAADKVEKSFPCPEGKNYYPYQNVGIYWQIRKKRSYVADPMGVGKTIQAIGLINSVPAIKKILVITKATLRINWRNELLEWLVRDLSIGICVGDEWEDGDIIIINYDILARHKSKIDSIHWDLLILDESQCLVNPGAIRTKMVVGYQPKETEYGDEPIKPIEAEFVTALSGTPLDNRPKELYALLNYLNPTFWGHYWWYMMTFCGPVDEGWGYTFAGSSNEKLLSRFLRQTVMIRRDKEKIGLNLPPKRYQIIEIPVDAVDLRSNLDEEFNYVTDVCNSLVEKAGKIFKSEAEFREAVTELNSQLKVAFDEFAFRRKEIGLKKLPYVASYLKDLFTEKPHKVLVFGHHRQILEELHSEFPYSALLHGGTPPAKRQDIIDGYNNDPDMLPFFGSIRAAGVGSNITSASHVLFVEEDLIPSSMNQAADRVHRIGQKNPVLITHIVLEGSIDALIAKIAIAKGNIIDMILNIGGANGKKKST